MSCFEVRENAAQPKKKQIVTGFHAGLDPTFITLELQLVSSAFAGNYTEITGGRVLDANIKDLSFTEQGGGGFAWNTQKVYGVTDDGRAGNQRKVRITLEGEYKGINTNNKYLDVVWGYNANTARVAWHLQPPTGTFIGPTAIPGGQAPSASGAKPALYLDIGDACVDLPSKNDAYECEVDLLCEEGLHEVPWEAEQERRKRKKEHVNEVNSLEDEVRRADEMSFDMLLCCEEDLSMPLSACSGQPDTSVTAEQSRQAKKGRKGENECVPSVEDEVRMAAKHESTYNCLVDRTETPGQIKRDLLARRCSLLKLVYEVCEGCGGKDSVRALAAAFVDRALGNMVAEQRSVSSEERSNMHDPQMTWELFGVVCVYLATMFKEDRQNATHVKQKTMLKFCSKRSITGEEDVRTMWFYLMECLGFVIDIVTVHELVGCMLQNHPKQAERAAGLIKHAQLSNWWIGKSFRELALATVKVVWDSSSETPAVFQALLPNWSKEFHEDVAGLANTPGFKEMCAALGRCDPDFVTCQGIKDESLLDPLYDEDAINVGIVHNGNPKEGVGAMKKLFASLEHRQHPRNVYLHIIFDTHHRREYFQRELEEQLSDRNKLKGSNVKCFCYHASAEKRSDAQEQFQRLLGRSPIQFFQIERVLGRGRIEWTHRPMASMHDFPWHELFALVIEHPTVHGLNADMISSKVHFCAARTSRLVFRAAESTASPGMSSLSCLGHPVRHQSIDTMYEDILGSAGITLLHNRAPRPDPFERPRRHFA